MKAVGTYSLSDDQDITIQIMTPDLTECLYSQECHADLTGYYVFNLEEPLEVDEYAIAVTYSKGASVEGESTDWGNGLTIKIQSESGRSFVQVDGNWLDMSEETTWDKLGYVTNNACIRALYE